MNEKTLFILGIVTLSAVAIIIMIYRLTRKKTTDYDALKTIVIGGDSRTSTLAYSDSGTVWKSSGFGYSQTQHSVLVRNGRILTTGADGYVYYSDDQGATFTRSTGAKLDAGMIIRADDTTVVVGGDGQSFILYSTDNGTSFSAATVALFTGTDVVYDIQHHGTQWVAVGSGGPRVVISSDGITWTTGVGSTVALNAGITLLHSVAYSNGVWFVGGTPGTTSGIANVYSTVDFDTWVADSANIFSTGGLVHDITSDGGTSVVAVGTNTANDVTVALSTDAGATFSNKHVTGPTVLNAVAYGNGVFVAGGGDGTHVKFIRSTDSGATFAIATVPEIDGAVTDIQYRDGVWVAVIEDSGATSALESRTLISVNDGATWTVVTGVTIAAPVSATVGFGGQLVAFDGSRWYAVGRSLNDKKNLWYSTTNGVSFTAGTGSTLDIGEVNDIATYDHTTYVAVGNEPTTDKNVAYSTNGKAWTASTGTTFGTGVGNAVVTDGTIFVAVGDEPTTDKNVVHSANGKVWTAATGAAFGTGLGNDVATDGLVFVAGGDAQTTNENLIYSADGKAWTAAATGARFGTGVVNVVKYANDVFIAGGNAETAGEDIAYSTDGDEWTAATAFTDGSAVVNDIAHGTGDTWVAVGDSNNVGPNILVSADNGKTFTNPVGQLITGAVASVVYANGTFVAGGDGEGDAHIVFSTDEGVTWTAADSFEGTTPVTKLYTQNGYFFAQTDGTYPMSTNVYRSHDGKTWSVIRTSDGSLL